MKAFAPRRTASVCQLCRQLSRRPAAAWSCVAAPLSQQTRSVSSSLSGKRARPNAIAASPLHGPRRWLATAPPPQQASTVTGLSQENLAQLDALLKPAPKAILDHPGAPSEDQVLIFLASHRAIAHTLVAPEEAAPRQTPQLSDKTPTSALLSNLNEPAPASVTKSHLLHSISAQAFEVLVHKPVFITPAILESYIRLQSLLQRPESIPAICALYRQKPVPRPTRPVTYHTPDPNKAAAAIPPPVADLAIDAAIASRDLILALSTVDATYHTTAYKRSKFLRSALFPITGALLSPLAAYTLATRFSHWQTTMDPAMATNIAMAGILTYSMAVGTVGYVALTTANDQMVRVTWAMGVPLWERWVREEERAAIDKIAQAFGFASKDKWGEEEGEEWEYLKDFCGWRGMMLDRVELMDGME